ncbi:MAG TPA: aminotransferase class V-fold PLP-dependent enzyme [Streptosporangiaceae bacterium]|nr:aminotransferase class V-fold PLP-dependent enzyme [Streptosporangiaceae bacterium]
MTTYPLEPGPERMQELGQASLDWVTRFVEGLARAPSDGRSPATRSTAAQGPDAAPREALRAALLAEPSEDPSEFGDLLALFGAAAAQAIETAGPAYLGYVPGGGLYVSALAEFLARSANRFTGLAATAPELVAMEHGVLRWLCRTFGLPDTAGGLVTTGGSMATLSAIVAARQDRLGEDFSAGTLYLSPRTHHSAAKAARIAGLPAAAVRVVPTTADLRMDVSAAGQMIAADRQAGRRPFLLVANAGSTDTGTIDRLGDLGRLAAREGLWFHVDGAYGGFFQLTRRGRAALSGVEAADSIVLDPHKGLFLPYGTGVLLVRDTAPLRAAHSGDSDGDGHGHGHGDGEGDGEGSYLQDLSADDELPDFSALGPELSRDFRGLRVWLPLRLHGVGAFRAALEEKLDLAAHAHADLARDPRLELPWPPDLSTVAFRLRSGDDDANLRLLDRINASGHVFSSSTRVGGRVLLRLCILSHRTHLVHVDRALQVIHAAAGES